MTAMPIKEHDTYQMALHALDSTRSFKVEFTHAKSGDVQRINHALHEVLRNSGCTVVRNEFHCERNVSGWDTGVDYLAHEEGLHLYITTDGDTSTIHIEDVTTSSSYFRRPLVAISRFIAQGFSPIAKHPNTLYVDAEITIGVDGELHSDIELTLGELFRCLNVKYQLSWRQIADMFALVDEHTAYALCHDELLVEDVLQMKREHSYYGKRELPTLMIGHSSVFDVDAKKFIRIKR